MVLLLKKAQSALHFVEHFMYLFILLVYCFRDNVFFIFYLCIFRDNVFNYIACMLCI